MMKVIDIDATNTANSVAELEMILDRRHAAGFNSFWLSHGAREYPKLSLLVSGELATLLYLPDDGHPGFRSVGAVPSLSSQGMSRFSISSNSADDVEVLNNAVVSWPTALKAAKEFSLSAELPPSIEWFEL